MEPLAIPDTHHLRAAQGWLELGNPREAEIELAKLSPASQGHPDAIEARWQVKAQRKQWEACCDLGRTLTRVAPAQPRSWVHLSYALHELRRTAEARDNLLRVVERFPRQALLRYNLACYECQLNQPGEAMRWLRAALQLAEEPDNLKQMALADVDLQPLWGEIAALEAGPGD